MRYVRLTIRNRDNTADAVVYSSYASDSNPVITQWPEGDGGSVDLVTGEVSTGEQVYRLADVSGTILDPSTTSNVVTGVLADTDAAWRVLGCRAVRTESDNGSDWSSVADGFVTDVTLTGIEGAITVGETDERELGSEVFTGETDLLFMTRVLGAQQEFGDLLQTPPFDWWEFEVEDTGDTTSDLPDDAVVLRFKKGWMYEKASGHEGFVLMEDEISNEARTAINALAKGYAVQVDGLFQFPDITVHIEDTSGTDVDDVTPYAWDLRVIGVPYLAAGKGDGLIARDIRVAVKWDGTLPSVGTTYRVTATLGDVSEDNPLHFVGHPVDLATDILDEIGKGYDSTAAANVKAALGPVEVLLRIKKPMVARDALEKLCFGPFGFAWRPTSDGWEFYTTRRAPTSTPSDTLDESDLFEPEHVAFRLNKGDVVNRVTWKLLNFSEWVEDDGGDQPLDGITETPVSVTFAGDDEPEDAPGVQVQVYELPGMVRRQGVNGGFGWDRNFLEAESTELLRRWGRGVGRAELEVKEGATTAKIGQFLILDLDHRPTAETGRTPTSQLGGSWIVEVVHRTETADGLSLEVLDFGPAGDAPEDVPEFTLAQGTDTRHVATYQITNSGDLSGLSVRIEMATGASEPTGSGALVGVVTPSATVTNLPSVTAGSKVWVRMRSDDGGLPGTWSDWASVALDALPAVTSLANAAGANDTERKITWTVGDSDLPVRIRWKLTADGSYTSSVTLPAGSSQYTITGLTPGSAYTVAVDHLDLSPFVGDGPDETTTWTAGSTIPTLNPPFNPAGHSDGAGVFGIEVTAYAAEVPSRVEVQIAVEDSVTPDTYGAYATDGSVVSVTPGRTRYSASAPNDGLKRKLKARHTKTGYTASAYTTEVIVEPWGAVDQPGSSIDQSTDSVMIWQAGEGESLELDGIGEGRLAIQYSLDGSTSFGFVDGVSGPYVAVSLTGARKGDWVEPEVAAKAEVCYRLVTVDADSVVAALTGWRLWKNAESVNYIRVGAEVSVAGSFSTDPVILNAWMETAATADTVPAPPDPDPPDGVIDPGPPEDTYPVARGLLFWIICDKGVFEDDGSGLKNVAQLNDLSGNANHLGGDADISGANVKRITDSESAAIPQINGRDPVNFRNAWLPFPTDLFDGMTEGEIFMVIQAPNGDPAPGGTQTAFHQLGPTDDAKLAESTGGGDDSGRIKEDFGSTVMHDTGDFPGALDEWFIYNVRAANGFYRIYKYTTAGGEELAFSTSTNTVSFSTGPRLGNRGNNSDYYLAEGSGHSVILTSEERALVVAEILERWDI